MLNFVLAGCITRGGESMALKLKTWVLPLATGKISLYYLVSLRIKLGRDLLLDFYNMSGELKNGLSS